MKYANFGKEQPSKIDFITSLLIKAINNEITQNTFPDILNFLPLSFPIKVNLIRISLQIFHQYVCLI